MVDTQRLSSIRGMRLGGMVAFFISLAIAACSNHSPQPGSSTPNAAQKPAVELTLVSFAVTKAAHTAIIPKFVAFWQKQHHQTVTFKQSYGGSGSQARAVIDGLDADIVHLALALDVNRIAKAGLIQPSWETQVPNQGIVSKSVATLVIRSGNPKGIKTWSDLAKPGIQVITADPKTSGVARWNFLALWNAAIQSGKSDSLAQAFVGSVYQNAPVLAKDAREASDVFLKQGQGDALINYENEVILAQQKGEKVTYVVPDVNISIDNPIAIVDKNVDKHGSREVATAFVNYLFTPEAQVEFAKVGFRPVDTSTPELKALAAKFPPIPKLSTVKDFGGWDAAQTKFFQDGAAFDQIQSQIQAKANR